MLTSVEKSEVYAALHLAETSAEQRRQLGQYFTPPAIAEFMAGLLHMPGSKRIRLLDPGAGTGTLGIAAAKHLSLTTTASVELTSFEIDKTVTSKLAESLQATREELGERFRYEFLDRDFLAHTSASAPLFSTPTRYDVIISNPPYFKTSPSDASDDVDPNAYARFMRRAADLLAPHGVMVFIVPRSFMSGFYFRKFRAFLRSTLTLERVHVFDSRRASFRNQGVLQENVIVMYRQGSQEPGYTEVSTSSGPNDLASATTIRVPQHLLYADNKLDAPIRVPTTHAELALIARVTKLPAKLTSLGMEISTGPVVPFRATQYLIDSGPSSLTNTVPLLWLQHVSTAGVTWPIAKFRKAQHLLASAPEKLRAANRTCVLVRRFSAKEDDRRLIAGAYLGGSVSAPWLGLENHLNVIYRRDGAMSHDEARGLARVLSSREYDDYFRICNGNTQVGASEIRELPLPSLENIVRLGRDTMSAADVNGSVIELSNLQQGG